MKKWYVKPCLCTRDLLATPILAGSMKPGGDDGGFGDGGDFEFGTSGGSGVHTSGIGDPFSDTKTGYSSSDSFWGD